MNWSKDAELVAYIVPFLSPPRVLCSSSFIFTLSSHLLKNSPSVLSCAVPDGSLRSFTSKDVFVQFACLQRFLPASDKGLEICCCRPASVIHWAVRLIKTTEIWWGHIWRSYRMHQLIKGQAGITYPSYVTWHKSRPRSVFYNLPVEPFCLTHAHVAQSASICTASCCEPCFASCFLSSHLWA